MIFNLVVVAFIVLFFLIGLTVGIVKGYVKVQTWAGEYLVSALLTIAVGAILNAAKVSPFIAGIITVCCAILFMFVCIGLSKLIKGIIERALTKRDDELRPYGAVGVVNRIWGGVELAIKGLLVAVIIIIPLFLVLDLAQIGALESVTADLYSGTLWRIIKPVIFDFIVIGAINIAIRHGFSTGIASAAWSLLTIGLIVGVAFISYNLVFSSGLFDGASTALSNHIGSWIDASAGVTSELGTTLPENLAYTVSRWLITVGLFILLAIVVVVVSYFVSKALSLARFGSAFYITDGVCGAIVLLIIALAVMLFLGYIIQPLYDLEFMERFTSYFESSTIAKYFYNENILINAGVPVLIPLREWLS